MTHTYVVRASDDGLAKTAPAKVAYRASPHGPVQVGLSTSLGDVEVLARPQRDRHASSHLQEWGVFAGLVLASSALPAAMWWYVSQHYENGLRKDKKHL